ncbi:hypothetical protein GCM10011297_16470 [Bacterioplanes sanyensis]|uniref:hypothetical protein n=1 Tax=Bacterioplanes sanyensis TaxID=1249553 RepID=UPI001678F54C|nr:hypothetical protein [Bacterioplanes sanyensis]GGY44234.1 hypothetical protein GCM10011297_16470 [Bacterioplanes sanyensis]
MSYATVKDVLEYSRKLHEHASNLYQQLRDQTQRDRVDMMLKLLSQHEDGLAEAMARICSNTAQRVLEEWHQFEPGSISEALHECRECHPDMSVDELSAIALRIDDYLINLYRYMASEATSDASRQLFDGLVQLLENEKVRTVRAALSVNDW